MAKQSNAEKISKRMQRWFDTAIYDKTHGVWNDDAMEMVFIKLDELHRPLTKRANVYSAVQYRFAVEAAVRFLRANPDPNAAKQLYHRINEDFGTAEQLVLTHGKSDGMTKLYQYIQTQRKACQKLLSKPDIGIYT